MIFRKYMLMSRQIDFNIKSLKFKKSLPNCAEKNHIKC